MEPLSARLARELGLAPTHVENVIRLIDEGCTIPFIARYRKELHGSMDDTALRALADRLQYLRSLEQRKAEILAAITAQEKLTPELEQAILSAATLAEAEDLYRPFKQKRRTRASVAREKGLGPLAEAIYAQTRQSPAPEDLAADFVDPEQGVEDLVAALAGASDIIAETISDDAALRGRLRPWLQRQARLLSRAAGDEDSVYRLYYDFSQPLPRLQGHQVLAMDRGEREGFLKVSLDVDRAEALVRCKRQLLNPGAPCAPFVAAAAEDAWDRLLWPSLERELRAGLTEGACEGAIANFSLNLRHLLLQPPLRGQVTLGLDPAYRTGCKCAVVDGTGKVLDTAVVYPTPPHNKTREAAQCLSGLMTRHGVTAIAIGNGTASGETERFAAEYLTGGGAKYMVVSEAGASVYSASKLAAEEFPDYDVSLRSAVSIARRLQDPLAELVKIDPKAIGVGQYQHDMPQARLSQALDGVVEDCVNAVGVDVNTASPALLAHVSGLSATTAKNLVKYREEHGPFPDRQAILKVPKLGPKTFEQCAGFLRVPGSAQFLDNTAVHPESYPAAEKLLALCGYSLADVPGGLGELEQRMVQLGEERLTVFCGAGLPTLQDVARELQKPGRDPRDSLPPPLLRSGAMDIADLQPGMRLPGTVRNVVDFGAFVDIGVHQDGLVHISQIQRGRRLRHPSEALAVGDVVEVTVLDVDPAKKRISLSLLPPAGPDTLAQ